MKLQNLTYQMKVIHKYKRGMHIFKEGDRNIDGIWFTIDGQFQISKTIKVKSDDAINNRKQQV